MFIRQIFNFVTSPQSTRSNLLIESEKSPLSFKVEMRGHHHGQSDMTLVASLDGRRVGILDFVLYEDEISIQMIRVTEKRQKIGTQMVVHLQSLYPEQDIDWGMTTPEGEKLRQSLPVDHKIIPEVQDKLQRLEDVRKQLRVFQKLADDFDQNPSEANRENLQSIFGEWNLLNDEEWNLVDELRHQKVSRTIIRI